MDPELLEYYNRELRHVREMGGEFAAEFPKIAGRLGLSGFECADPYVERLLEGFAFLAARVQLKIDAEFPRFTQHLLEMVYPHFLAPTPSMAVVQLQPDLTEGALSEGVLIPKGTVLRSIIGKEEQTACEYRTAHALSLWPLCLSEAEYLAGAGAVARICNAEIAGVKAAVRLRLKTTAGVKFNQLALRDLPVFLRGGDNQALRLYEHFLGNGVAIVAQTKQRQLISQPLPADRHIRRVGFGDDEALLPQDVRSFQGYRLLKEYFAFPDRFLFVNLSDLNKATQSCLDDELDLIMLFDRSDDALVDAIDESNFALFCTPAINLFPKRADRIHLDKRQAEYHLVPERSRPLDYEIYSVGEVAGFGSQAKEEQIFEPFYGSRNFYRQGEYQAFYTLRREQRLLSSRQRREGPRSSYVGSEIFIALVDGAQAPYSSELRQLGLNVLCTNRDLPLHMPLGTGKSDFSLQIGAPVEAIRCVAGPTPPRPSTAKGETAWKLISHLSLNYLSLLDSSQQEGAAALRELLSLYAETSDLAIAKQIEGVLSVASKPIVERIDVSGPINFGRGLEIEVRFDEGAFEGSGIFLLGTVLEQFFRRYVSVNSFTKTVISSLQRGEVMRWPVRIGKRQTI